MVKSECASEEKPHYGSKQLPMIPHGGMANGIVT